jgi:signal transduction histidine kinase
VPDGPPMPVRVDRTRPDRILVAPVEPGGADAYAVAPSTAGMRVLLVADAPTAPDERVMDHLVTTASAVLSAERSAVSRVVRESLHEREEERRRWARELHDETLQQLGALQVLLTSALRKADVPDGQRGVTSDRPVEAMRQASELVAGQIRSLRALITELRPAGLDDLGLTPPLQALARRTEQLSGISVRLHVSLRYADGVISTRLLPDVELAVYRVVQEALTNIRRHSTATRVTVTVIEDDETVVAEVSDNGRGFDAHRATGFGLSGMRERAELAHGTLEVTSATPDGHGTTVRLVVPARHR